MKKKILSGILAAAMLIGMGTQASQSVRAADPEPIVLEKSTQGNPITGFDENGDLIYAGDPAILVDGDTVYLYVGHDAQAGGGSYNMPDYLCYSTTDLKEWKYEGVTMSMKNVSWSDDSSAWASQVIKYKNKYYLLYCAENKGSRGKELGIAVSDSPTGPFVDRGDSLFDERITNTEIYEIQDNGATTTIAKKYGRRGSFGWEDIDPTAWIEEDENGVEHVYMAWGNTNPWMCELDLDGNKMDIKDQDGDGQITQGDDKDIWYQRHNIPNEPAGNGSGQVNFTEAPYLYRRQNQYGEYYGKYYMFFAMHWREEMGYATTDDIRSNEWTYGGKVMEPTATSDTNHPAVFDFKGHTYFIYHNGSMPAGMGQRRVICIEELIFNEDGSINYIQETSTGLTGIASTITNEAGLKIAHEAFNNSLQDSFYPIIGDKAKSVSLKSDAAEADAKWEIIPGRYGKANQSYVSIESYNKPGLYLMADSSQNVVLAHDHNGNATAPSNGITSESKSMTFKTYKGFAGEGVTFESLAYPGYYLTASADGSLTVSQNPEVSACTFYIDSEKKETVVESIVAQKTKRAYEKGETIATNDIRVKLIYSDGTEEIIKEGFTVDASGVDASKAGKQNLTVTYQPEGKDAITCQVGITIWDYPEIEDLDTTE